MSAPKAKQQILEIPIGRIKADPEQPRKRFDKDSLERLSASLKRCGQRQPGIVRPVGGGDGSCDYIIVDGERRWRASKLAGLAFYRAILTDRATRGEWFEESVISNFGREEHTPIEICNAIVRLREERGMTIEQIADAMAKSTSWVNQHLQLLKLDERVRRLVDDSLPEGQQLAYSIAVMVLAKIEDKERQFEAALCIVEHRLGLYEARTFVAKLGNQRGFQARRNRPSDDLPVLENFVKRLMADSEFVLTLRHADFSAILQTRSLDEVGKLGASLDSAMFNLQAIRQSVDRVIDARQERVREFACRAS